MIDSKDIPKLIAKNLKDQQLRVKKRINEYAEQVVDILNEHVLENLTVEASYRFEMPTDSTTGAYLSQIVFNPHSPAVQNQNTFRKIFAFLKSGEVNDVLVDEAVFEAVRQKLKKKNWDFSYCYEAVETIQKKEPLQISWWLWSVGDLARFIFKNKRPHIDLNLSKKVIDFTKKKVIFTLKATK